MVSYMCPRRLEADSVLIKNLHEKKRLLGSSDASHAKFKTALVIEGGVFLGSYGGGVAWGLEDAGMSEVFDYVIGVSTGSITGAYLLAGQMPLGAPIFYEDLVDGRFLNLRRLKGAIDLEFLIDIFATKKPLGGEKIRGARSQLLIPVTNMATGKSEVFSAKDESTDIIPLIRAALSLPGLSRVQAELNGQRYCDGVYSFTNPVSYAVDELGCTDVVVVKNRACSFKSDPARLAWLEAIASKVIFRDLSPEFRETYTNRRSGNGRDLELMWGEDPGVNIGLICRDEMPIGRFSQDGDKIKRVVQEAREQAAGLFG